MMAVLIMATVGYDFDKAEALWGKPQRDLLHSAFFRVAADHRTFEWAVGLRGDASPSAPPLSQRSLKGARARAVLRKAGRYLAINPVYLLGMSPGSTVETIRAVHRKAVADGGGCMKHLHGGNSKTGRTAEQHRKAVADGGGSMKHLHGGNSKTGWTAEQHAKVSGGRASLHEDAINILFANWEDLPRTMKPGRSLSTRTQSYTATRAYESRMVDQVLSYHYNAQVSVLRSKRGRGG
jgi:hypothetical protein